jgi:hypothetical protein
VCFGRQQLITKSLLASFCRQTRRKNCHWRVLSRPPETLAKEPLASFRLPPNTEKGTLAILFDRRSGGRKIVAPHSDCHEHGIATGSVSRPPGNTPSRTMAHSKYRRTRKELPLAVLFDRQQSAKSVLASFKLPPNTEEELPLAVSSAAKKHSLRTMASFSIAAEHGRRVPLAVLFRHSNSRWCCSPRFKLPPDTEGSLGHWRCFRHCTPTTAP